MEKGIHKRQVFVNAIMSVVQVVVTGGVLFVLYRFLLNTIGVEKLGIWSIILATTSIANITNFGFSAGIVKFVAKYVARGEEERVVGVIQTSAISIAVLSGFLLLIVYPFANYLLSWIVPLTNIQDAISVLPYALLSFWFMTIASIFQASLDGYQRIDLRNMLLMTTAIFYLILCFFLVPAHGLIGLAYAQVIQSSVLLIGSWFMLKYILPLLPIMPCRWNHKLFREMVGYGLNFQIISISQIFCDPITKALLTKFGGLTMVGFYEMASRMILQFRALLVSANQVLVPVIADFQEKNPNLIQKIYKDNYGLMFYVSFPFYFMIIALIPSISEIWIGHYEGIFVVLSVLLAVSLFINTLSVPAYFSYLGIGELKWNTLGHAIPAIMNVILGLMSGYFFGGIGVIIAWIFSSITTTLIVIISYHRRFKISLKELLPRENTGLVITCLLAVFFTFLMHNRINHIFTAPIAKSVTILAFPIIVFIPVWLHPMRKSLIGWISNKL